MNVWLSRLTHVLSACVSFPVFEIVFSCWCGRGWSHVWYQIFSGRAAQSWQTERPPCSDTGVCVRVHFNQWEQLCGPHGEHGGCSPGVRSLPLNQTIHEEQKVACYFILFLLQHFVIPLLSKELASSSWAATTKMWQNFPVPSCAHLFSAPLCLCPSILAMMCFLYFTVDIVLWMSEHFANEEAWTRDRQCRQHPDTLARTCCAA